MDKELQPGAGGQPAGAPPAKRPLDVNGGISVAEADMPLSELSGTYVPDDDQEPVQHDE